MELSTRFAAITTSPNARVRSFSAAEAVKKAKANLRYIDRRAAVRKGDARGAGPLMNLDGSHVRTRSEGRAALRRAIDARAAKGGKNGTRVAEKIMFSLPNDFAGKPAREALVRVLGALIEDSEALAFGVIHTDKPDNLHCHILAVDGAESEASARKRRPHAKRLRRQDFLRMNERGRPKKIRALIAAQINAVAELYGLTKVEHQSYRERGVSLEPGFHQGPQKIAREARGAVMRALPPRVRQGRRPEPRGAVR